MFRRRERELRQGRTRATRDPRDLSGGGRFSRFRPRPQQPPPGSGRGGCCLWPFMLAVVVGGAGVARAARGRG